MDLHAFGGNQATNPIRSLDFPNLLGIGAELKGCRMLTTLKLGHSGPISFYTSFPAGLNTENIDLYIGKYEFENHVKGNVFYPHIYRDLYKEIIPSAILIPKKQNLQANPSHSNLSSFTIHEKIFSTALLSTHAAASIGIGYSNNSIRQHKRHRKRSRAGDSDLKSWSYARFGSKSPKP